MSEIMFSHQKRVKKPFFLSDLPQGVLFYQNKSQLSNLQNGHTGLKMGVKKKHLCMTILKVWQLTPILVKQDPLGEVR